MTRVMSNVPFLRNGCVNSERPTEKVNVLREKVNVEHPLDVWQPIDNAKAHFPPRPGAKGREVQGAHGFERWQLGLQLLGDKGGFEPADE